MPCTYYESPEELAQAAAKAKARRNKELNRVTDLLCKVCEELYTDANETFEDTCTAISDIEGLKKWWLKHQKRDANRSAK